MSDDKMTGQIIDKTTGKVIAEIDDVKFQRAFDEAYPPGPKHFSIEGVLINGDKPNSKGEIIKIDGLTMIGDHNCWCSRETLMAKGCQCGGK